MWSLQRQPFHPRPSASLLRKRSSAWDRLFSGPRPASLHAFREIGVEGRRAVTTAGDILLHIRADQMDLCFELATQLLTRLGDAVTVVDEVQGFRYFDMRSMVGFVDGTENPVGHEAVDFTMVGDEDPAFTNGCSSCPPPICWRSWLSASRRY